MAMPAQSTRVRYPVRAVLAVGAASLVFMFNMIVGFLFMALIPPMIPIYACVLFAGGSLVMSALRFAQRVSIRGPAAMLPAGTHEEEARDRPAATRAA